jgi:hypothetical protein
VQEEAEVGRNKKQKNNSRKYSANLAFCTSLSPPPSESDVWWGGVRENIGIGCAKRDISAKLRVSQAVMHEIMIHGNSIC